jgi:hypothetical protein
MMEIARLSNGTEEAIPLVITITMVLESLLSKPVMFYELVMMARDKNHVPFGNTGSSLCKTGLINDDMSMHASTRNIIQCCVEGEGLNMSLVSPLAVERGNDD